MNELERVTENLRSNEYCTYAQMNEAANMLEAMHERIAELEKDAARHRWLRLALADREKGVSHHFCSIRYSEELDQAIDTAMQKD